ncbi:MAG: helix-turn-helix domain-containing protein [Candidatus Gastranaerophilaceae bacterium]
MQEFEVTYHGIISTNIKKLRTQAKLSQEALAEKLSCSREFISRVENKKERISLNMMFKIARIFNINPSSLLQA